MISERAELLGRLLRYHALMRSVSDNRVRGALQSAIAGIERQLKEIDRGQERTPTRDPATHVPSPH
jgi:hypothetical protein